MGLTRRQFVRLMSTLAAISTTGAVAGCGDDASNDGTTTDGGLDAGADAATDGGLDAGEDAGEVPFVDDDWQSDPTDPDDLPEYSYDGEPGPETLFDVGVASGDPLPGAVILWTHVAPDTDGPVEVWWEVARDPDFVSRVQVGTIEVDGETDYCAKVDVGDLLPGRPYYYRFHALGRTSVVGRTRTAPVGRVQNLRFGVCSCACYTSGYYHGYRSLAERSDLHAVLHLGDYIYEGGATYLQQVEERVHVPASRIVELDDYRQRYHHYRTDEDLQEVHRQHPMIHVWDDHESLNNSWRDGADGFDGTAEEWAVRKGNAYRAMIEWMPIRETGTDLRVWRTFQYGDLAEVIMLDTRIYDRDEQVNAGSPDMLDPERSILGEEQASWLDERLCETPAQWKIIGQQVMFAPLQIGGTGLNPDQWDGYAASRERIYDVLGECGVNDVVVLTGDIHSTWASDLPRNPIDPETYDPETGEGSLGVEFVCTSISTQSLGDTDALEDFVLDFNPHMKWVDLNQRGYLVLDLTPERAQAAWTHYESVLTPDRDAAGEYTARIFSTQTGANRLREDDTAAQPLTAVPAPAP